MQSAFYIDCDLFIFGLFLAVPWMDHAFSMKVLNLCSIINTHSWMINLYARNKKFDFFFGNLNFSGIYVDLMFVKGSNIFVWCVVLKSKNGGDCLHSCTGRTPACKVWARRDSDQAFLGFMQTHIACYRCMFTIPC